MLRRRFLSASAGEVIPEYEYTMKIGYYNDNPIPFLGGYYKHSNLNLIGTLEGGAFSLLELSFADSYGEYIISSEAPDLGMFVSVEGSSLDDPEKGYTGGLLLGAYVTYFPDDPDENMQGTVWEGGVSVDSLILDGDIQNLYLGFDAYIPNLGVLGPNVKTLKLPQSLIKIGPRALFLWKLLTSLEIPENVINLGNNCLPTTTDSNFRTLILKPLTPPASSNLFYNLPEDFKIRVYADCIDTYKNDDYYSLYADYIDTINNAIIYYSDTACKFGSSLSSINSTFLNGRGRIESSQDFLDVNMEGWWNGTPHTIIFPSSVKSIKFFPFTLSVQNILFSSLIDSIKSNILNSTEWYKSQPDGFVILNDILYDYKPNDDSLTGELIIPEGVIGITDGLFKYSDITSITFPSTLKRIESNAFRQCTELDTINIPASVEYIGNGAFTNIWAYDITVDDNNLFYADYDSDCIVEIATKKLIVASDPNRIPNNVEIIGPCACTGLSSHLLNLETLIIPDNVKILEDYAYSDFRHCTSLTLSENLEIIGPYAFLNNRAISSITIPNKVTQIGSRAFSGCSSLKSIVIPDSVTSIGNNTFEYCSSLTSIMIGNGVTSIERLVFQDCSSLTSVVVAEGNIVLDSRENCNAIIETATNTLIAGCKNTIIPNSVTSIGEYAFWGCSSIRSIVIPNSVTSIERCAFQYCKGLTSMTIPDSVTSIGNSAFFGCDALNTIIIPDSVTNIGDSAFYNCKSLSSITFQGTMAQWTGINLGSNWKLSVPATVVHCTDGDVEI